MIHELPDGCDSTQFEDEGRSSPSSRFGGVGDGGNDGGNDGGGRGHATEDPPTTSSLREWMRETYRFPFHQASPSERDDTARARGDGHSDADDITRGGGRKGQEGEGEPLSTEQLEFLRGEMRATLGESHRSATPDRRLHHGDQDESGPWERRPSSSSHSPASPTPSSDGLSRGGDRGQREGQTGLGRSYARGASGDGSGSELEEWSWGRGRGFQSSSRGEGDGDGGIGGDGAGRRGSGEEDRGYPTEGYHGGYEDEDKDEESKLEAARAARAAREAAAAARARDEIAFLRELEAVRIYRHGFYVIFMFLERQSAFPLQEPLLPFPAAGRRFGIQGFGIICGGNESLVFAALNLLMAILTVTTITTKHSSSGNPCACRA